MTNHCSCFIKVCLFSLCFMWLEPERGIRCKRKGMCKISQLENYELSLMVKMKLWTRSLVLSVMILVVSKSIFWHLQVQIVWEGAVEPTGSFPDTSGSLWIRFWYLSDNRYVFWHFRSLCHFGPNWESLVISIQFGYIWYPRGYVNSMAYVRYTNNNIQQPTGDVMSRRANLWQ